MKNKKQKRLLLCLCFAIMFSATAGIAACGKNDKQDSSNSYSSSTTDESSSSDTSDSGNVDEEVYGEPGVYYFDLDEADAVEEYLLSFTDRTFTLFMNNETKSGSYTVDENGKYNLVFDDSEETAVVTLGTNALTLEYNGNSYGFLEKIAYSVSYETNGGSEVAANKVLNGKTLVKPADPVKKGYLFIGWYIDAEFSEPFAFGATPVNTDVTLYARFVEATIGENEYKAELLVDGEVYATQNTVSGALYLLPTPEKDGATFAGWWVSHYEDETKLSYKYEEGQKLTENVKLYAVWAGNAPLVTVTEEGLSWTVSGDAESYTVKVTAPDGSVKEDNVSVNSYKYNVAAGEAGDYVFEVTANGETTTLYYQNKALDKVSLFMVAEPSVLVYGAVKNAEKYIVSVVCGNEEHVHTEIDNGTSTSFNFANCEMMPGGIQFTVKAIAKGYVTSISDTFTYSRDLPAISAVKVDETTDTVVWNPVAGATSYVVEVVKGEEVTKINVGATTSYNLKKFSGEMLIKVYPVAKNYNSPEAATVEYNKDSLAMPTNVAFDGAAITWDAVEGANGYKVSVGDKEYETTENSLALTDEMYVDGQDSYVVKVTAVSDTFAPSVASDAITVNYENMDPVLVYDKGVITWSSVVNAYRYAVKVNDGNEISVKKGVTSMAVTLTQAGENVIKVRYYDEDERPSDWATVTVNAYKISFDSRGGKAVAPIYKALGDKLDMPISELDGYEFDAWYNLPGGPASNAAKFTDEYFNATNDIMLYANWTSRTYNVTFNVGTYGIMDTESVAVRYNNHFKLPVATSQDTTKVFGGWYEEANGQGIQYTDAEGNSLSPWVDARDVTLHAGWIEVLNYKLIDGGTAYSVSQGVGIKYVTHIKIPETYNGKPVKVIEPEAFKDCKNLISIEIPDTITSVEFGLASATGEKKGSSFQGCNALESVTVYCVKGDHAANPHQIYYESFGGSLVYTDPTNENVKTLVYVPKGITEKYTIPYGVTHIPEELFYSSKLKELTIPSTVTFIGASAFGSSSITKFNFEKAPEGTAEVELTFGGKKNSNGDTVYQTFSWCDFTEITLPARMKNFHADIFYSCSDLKAVHIEGEGLYTSTDDGIVCETIVENGAATNNKRIIYYPIAKEGAFTIPLGVTEIGESAFNNCDKLTAIEIPGYVTKIGKKAFNSCGGLTEIRFSDDAEALEIGESAFVGCSNVKEIYISAGVTKIGKEAFKNNSFTSTSSIEKITFAENAVAEIGDSAFEGLASVTELTIPKTLPSIGYRAFRNCSGLTSVTFLGGEGDPTLSIQGEAFYGCDGLTSVTLPANLVYLGASAFGGISGLKTVYVEVGENAVLENKAFGTTYANATYYVKEVYLGKNVPNIEVNGIFGSATLEKVDVAKGNLNYTSVDGVLFDKDVTQILYFPNAKSGEYELPDTITVIGAKVFDSKAGLTQITLSHKVTKIGDNAFYGCKNLTTVIFEPTPEGVEKVDLTIGDSAFNACTKLATIELPVRTVSIGESAFRECKALTNMVVPEGVKTIGEFAFNSCEGLETLSLPSTVEEMGAGESVTSGTITTYVGFRVLYGCKNLASITVAENNANFGSKDGVLYSKNDKGNLSELLICPIKKTGVVDVPKTVSRIWSYAFNLQLTSTSSRNDSVQGVKWSEGLALEEGEELTFGDKPFYCCYALEKIELPTGLKKIPAKAFSDCKGLKEIFIPNTVTSIENQFLQYCSAIEKITFQEGGTEGLRLEDSVTVAGSYGDTIDYGVFWGIRSPYLTEIVLPARTSYIGKYAFCADETMAGSASSNPTYLEKITIPAGVATISDYAFYMCTKLTDVTFAEGSQLTSIGKYAFVQTAITGIQLPENLETINTSAFSRTKLTSIHIPASVKELGDSVFSSCSQLSQVTFAKDSTLESIGVSTFYDMDALTEIELPASLKTIAKNAFLNSSNLASITFATTTVDGKEVCNLQSIGENAFMATGLTRFDFPVSTATSIELGKQLFSGCKKLTTVYLSKSVGNIDDVLTKCASLKTVLIAEDNENFLADPNLPLINNKEGTTVQFTYGAIDGDTFIVPEGVKEIGTNAFEGQAFKKIVLPKSLLTISNNAFLKCTNLETVEFAEGSMLQTIGDYAFQYCFSLKTIHIPEGVTTIGKYAFDGCNSLSEITLSEGLTTLDDYAFRGTKSLQTINLPDSLTYLGTYLFQYGGLTEIVIPKNITMLGKPSSSGFSTSTTGYMFNECVDLKKVTLPEGLTGIGTSAFNGCINLTTINIPDTVTIIAGSAFKNCANLDGITLPEGLEKTGSDVFANCTSLTSVNVPGISSVGGNMFMGCTNLATVTLSPDLTQLGAKMFQNTALTSIDLSNITKLGANALEGTRITSVDISHITDSNLANATFMNCLSLTSVTLNPNAKALKDSMFQGCTALTKIDLPNSINYLGKKTFMGSGLTEVTLPTSLKVIGTSATAASASSAADTFRDCVSLTKVNGLEKITKLAKGVFAGCTSLTSVDLAACTQVGYECFMGCTSLTDVDLPKVTSLGSNAFTGCTQLSSVNLNSALTSLGTESFMGCTSLVSITLPAKLTSVGAKVFMDCTALESITIPANVTYIGYSYYSETSSTGYTFAGCTSLQSVTFESDAKFKTLGAYVFSGCTSLTSITLPSSTTNINSYAFEGSGITSFTLPAKVAKLAKGVFGNCEGLTAIKVAEGNTAFKSGADGALYSADGLTLIAYPAGAEGIITLEGIESIASDAFFGCDKITRIYLPETLTSISDYAFNGCTGLLNLVIPNSVTEIGKYAFQGCEKLRNLTLSNSLVSIGDYAFKGCAALEDLTFYSGLTTIGTQAFSGSGLVKVVLPETVASIGYGAFSATANLEEFIFETSISETGVDLKSNSTTDDNRGLFENATKLKKVVLPEGVTSLPYFTFKNCTSLTDVTLPSTLTKMNNYAFENCTSLEALTLPNNLTSTGMGVFQGSGLKNIVMPDSITSISSNTFNGCFQLESVVMPATLENTGVATFYNCTALKSVVLPKEVTTIGSEAFYNCTSMKRFVVPETVTNIIDSYLSGGPFFGWKNDQTIYISCSQVDTNKYWTVNMTSGKMTFWLKNCEAVVVFNYEGN